MADENEWWDLVSRIQKGLDKFCDLPVDGWNGHLKSGADFFNAKWQPAPARLRELLNPFGFSKTARLSEIVQALTDGVMLGTPLLLTRGFCGRAIECAHCGDSLKLGFNGKSLCVISERDCPNPNGLVTESELNVPSGRLVIENDLREMFPFYNDYDLNSLYGCHLQTMEAAGAGLAYGFVGNTCPCVYQSGDSFVIGSFREELWDGENHPWGTKVAYICTDLWWYSICDADEMGRRQPGHTYKTVAVRPGVYRFRQEQGIDRDLACVAFATFEWVREPDPIKDYTTTEQDWTATEVLIQHCIDWPTLYLPEKEGGDYEDRMPWPELDQDQKIKALARAASRCILGSGMQRTESGSVFCKVSPETQKLAAEFGEVPLFDSPHRWYPIHGRIQTSPLNESFARLTLNICHNNLKFGETLGPDSKVDQCRERMRNYAQTVGEIQKRFPDLVLEGAVFPEDLTTYVENFDFGTPPEDPRKEGRKRLAALAQAKLLKKKP